MTKSVKFDENGRRSEIEIQLFELNSQGSSLIGTWSPDEGIKQVLATSTVPIEGDAVVNSLKNRTFIVLTALVNIQFFYFFIFFNILPFSSYFISRLFVLCQTAPYGMLKEASLQLTGNDRYEGFGIDIINELSLMLGFKYEFRLQEDKDYGSISKVTKEWTGMIRALQDGV